MKEDLKLRLNVEGELAAESGVGQTHINVAAQNGVVTLTGTVHTFAEKTAAVRAAQRVAGGREVTDSLQIRLVQER